MENIAPIFQKCTICFDSTIIGVYGVIFTIGVSLAVYIYGIQDRSEKSALITETRIGGISIVGIIFFCLSFLELGTTVNYIFVIFLSVLFIRTFLIILDFNKNEYSKDKFVNDFKIKTIINSLNEFVTLNKRRNKLNEDLSDESKYVRYIHEEDDSYYLVKAEADGYLEDIDLTKFNFESNNPNDIAVTNKGKSSEKRKIFVSMFITIGSKIAVGTILGGLEKTKTDKEDGNRTEREVGLKIEEIKTAFPITENFLDPFEYIGKDLEENYNKLFRLISDKNVAILESKLKDFFEIIKLITAQKDQTKDILGEINSKLILPLQDHSVKNFDLEVVRRVMGSTWGNLYDSVEENDYSTFNLFLFNISRAFYQSFDLDEKNKSIFQERLFRSLSDLARYSIKPRLIKKGSDYVEFALRVLSFLNSILKNSLDKKDKESFTKILSFLNNLFTRESYEHEEMKAFDDVIKFKKSIIFGFTAWFYSKYNNQKNDPFFLEALKDLMNSLQKDRIVYYREKEDEINYYIDLYLKAQELSRNNRGLFSWESWDMPEGEVYTVTVDRDIRKLLVDRLLNINIKNPDTQIKIEEGNYDDLLALVKIGSVEFDIIKDASSTTFFALKDLQEESIEKAKEKTYLVFEEISNKYNENVKKKVITQKLNIEKFNSFAKENLESYYKGRVLSRIGIVNKAKEKASEGFGFNLLLHKEQFILDTTIHYVNDNQFGESLARSEDNRILESIFTKKEEEGQLNKEDIVKYIHEQSSCSYVVFWLSQYSNLQDLDQDRFSPYWQESEAKSEKGIYYQGSINGKNVYLVKKEDEYKKYSDKVFLFDEEPFSFEEFEPDVEMPESNVEQLIYPTSDKSIYLSITNLSESSEERDKIVQTWVDKELEKKENKEKSMEDLKVKVVLRFFKGVHVELIKISKSKIQILNISL